MKVPIGATGVPSFEYFRVDANDGSGIYFIKLDFC